jgi:hypothetical protein
MSSVVKRPREARGQKKLKLFEPPAELATSAATRILELATG